LSAYRAGLQSSIQLCANWMALGPQLSKDIGTFLGDEPGARIHLHEALDADIPLAVIEGTADLGVTARRTDLPELICLPYRPTQFVLISPDTPDSPPPPRWPDALGQPMVTLRSALALHKHLHGEAARFGKRLDVRLEVDSHDSLIEMVRSGLGVGVLPAAALEARPLAGLHQQVIPADWAQAMLYVCASAQHAHAHQLARRLLDALHCASTLNATATEAPQARQATRDFANPAL
jgi:DNA-binding transcriptional LysR family regulator